MRECFFRQLKKISIKGKTIFVFFSKNPFSGERKFNISDRITPQYSEVAAELVILYEKEREEGKEKITWNDFFRFFVDKKKPSFYVFRYS